MAMSAPAPEVAAETPPADEPPAPLVTSTASPLPLVMPEKGRPGRARASNPPDPSAARAAGAEFVVVAQGLASEQGGPGRARRAPELAQPGRSARLRSRSPAAATRNAPRRSTRGRGGGAHPALARAALPRPGRRAPRPGRGRLVLRDAHGRLLAVHRRGLPRAGGRDHAASGDAHHDARGRRGGAVDSRRGAHDRRRGAGHDPARGSAQRGPRGHAAARGRRHAKARATCGRPRWSRAAAGRQLSGGRARVRDLDAARGQERGRHPAPHRLLHGDGAEGDRQRQRVPSSSSCPSTSRGATATGCAWGVYPSSSKATAALGTVPEYFRSGGAAPKVLGASEVVP